LQYSMRYQFDSTIKINKNRLHDLTLMQLAKSKSSNSWRRKNRSSIDRSIDQKINESVSIQHRF